MKRIFLVLFATLAIIAPSFAATINIDTTMTDQAIISSIEGAQAGDEVVIAPGTYRVRLYLTNSGTATNPIVIRGADSANRPVFDYTGSPPPTLPGSNTNAWFALYAIVIQENRYITIEDIVVKGANNPTNGNSAGIYIGPMGTHREPADPGTQPENITLRRVEISHCDDGLASTGHNVLVVDSYLHSNGLYPSSSARHNTYIHGGSITFRNTRFDNSGGHNVHTRAALTIVENCDLGTFKSPCQIQVLTPKADMGKGVPFTQTFIMRDSAISSDRNHANPIRDMIEVINSNAFSGLTQNVEMYGNTYTGPGGISRAVWLNKTAGTVGMGLKTAQNNWSGIGSFLALAAGEDVNSSAYMIDVQDYSDASLPSGSGTVPVDPPVENNINFLMTWNQADTANLHGWLIWSTTDQANWGEPEFVEYVDGMVFQSSASLPVAEEYFFKIRPVNVLMQEGVGADKSVSLDVALPGPTTEFTVVIE